MSTYSAHWQGKHPVGTTRWIRSMGWHESWRRVTVEQHRADGLVQVFRDKDEKRLAVPPSMLKARP